jgi:hypothetical protein
MKYLLTQEEYDALQNKADNIIKDARDTIQDLCTRVANYEVLTKGWARGEPWGCILTKTTEYCDECPVQDVCPYEWKEWSK